MENISRGQLKYMMKKNSIVGIHTGISRQLVQPKKKTPKAFLNSLLVLLMSSKAKGMRIIVIQGSSSNIRSLRLKISEKRSRTGRMVLKLALTTYHLLNLPQLHQWSVLVEKQNLEEELIQNLLHSGVRVIRIMCSKEISTSTRMILQQ